jgi:hypothetical protein
MLRFATVVDDTVNGAVPVATFDTITGAVKLPVVVRLVPVATPITGVTRVVSVHYKSTTSSGLGCNGGGITN